MYCGIFVDKVTFAQRLISTLHWRFCQGIMSPPNFENIGSRVRNFSEDDIYWCNPNVKFNFISRKDPTFLFSLISHNPNYSSDKFYLYNDHRAIINATLNKNLHKDAKFSFTYSPPDTFKSKVIFPLLNERLQQEVSGTLTSYNSRKDYNAYVEDPELSSLTSYVSDNYIAAFQTDVRAKKIESYCYLVLQRNNFVIAPRVGLSVKKPSRYYMDLKLAYERDNVEVFTHFSWRKLQKLRTWQFGFVHKTPKLDVGFYSEVKNKASRPPLSTFNICYRLNSWSFFKISFTNNLNYAFSYGFTCTKGVCFNTKFLQISIIIIKFIIFLSYRHCYNPGICFQPC